MILLLRIDKISVFKDEPSIKGRIDCGSKYAQMNSQFLGKSKKPPGVDFVNGELSIKPLKPKQCWSRGQSPVTRYRHTPFPFYTASTTVCRWILVVCFALELPFDRLSKAITKKSYTQRGCRICFDWIRLECWKVSLPHLLLFFSRNDWRQSVP